MTTPALNDDQKRLTLKVIKIAVVVIPVLGGAVAAYLTGSPFDWGRAIQIILPALLGE